MAIIDKNIVFTHLTNKEYEIMSILWSSEKPLSSAEILHSSVEHSFSDRSLHALLNKLIQKNYIKINGIIKCTKTNARLYTYTLGIEEYSSMHINKIYENSNTHLNFSTLLSCLVKEKSKNTKKDSIEELEKWIKNQKND